MSEASKPETSLDDIAKALFKLARLRAFVRAPWRSWSLLIRGLSNSALGAAGVIGLAVQDWNRWSNGLAITAASLIAVSLAADLIGRIRREPTARPWL